MIKSEIDAASSVRANSNPPGRLEPTNPVNLRDGYGNDAEVAESAEPDQQARKTGRKRPPPTSAAMTR